MSYLFAWARARLRTHILTFIGIAGWIRYLRIQGLNGGLGIFGWGSLDPLHIHGVTDANETVSSYKESRSLLCLCAYGVHRSFCLPACSCLILLNPEPGHCWGSEII